jgi:MSHA biogenesis protein MshQ
VVGCSSDNFAIRPASFSTPVATDANWLTPGSARALGNAAASGGVVHAAGAPFRVSFGARDAAGNALPSYAGNATLAFDGCALPSPCSAASAASLSAWFGVTSGVANTDNAQYSEVGAFIAHAQDATFAAVDAADTPAAQRLITSPTVTIGRFVPANYLLSLASAPSFAPAQATACTGNPAWNFTWIGQPFAWQAAPVVTISAQSAEGLVLEQYAGALFKLSAAALSLGWGSNAPVSAPFTASGQTVTVTSLGAGIANASFGTGSSFAFTRPATPVGPFNANVALTVTLSDSSESAVAGNAVIPGVAPLVIDGGGTGIEFDGTNASGANLVGYGRLQVMSMHGDSRRKLAMAYETQMWSGSAWYRNQRDSCVQPAATSVALSNWGGSLSACTVSVASVSRAVRGQGSIVLSAPVAAAVGGIDVGLRLAGASGSTCSAGTAQAATSAGLAWLQGPWTSAPNYTSDPMGRATFGRLRVDNLIRRELF